MPQKDTLSLVTEKLVHRPELARAVFGPFEDLRRHTDHLGLVLNSSKEIQQFLDFMLGVERQFSRPIITNITELLTGFHDSDLATVLKRYQMQTSELQCAIGAMSSPWFDTANKLQSVVGFATLQGIGQALRAMQPFDRRLSAALRIDLGDWREKITWNPTIFADPLARTSFYLDRGLNPSLTRFPNDTFEESIALAEITEKPAPLAHIYSRDTEAAGCDEEDIAFERTNRAHDRLQRFESQVRNFIDEQMRTSFGVDWIKHQVPNEIRQKWLDKKKKDKGNGKRDYPLIAYADFTDYVPIITRKDNWEVVFKGFFLWKPSVEESFRRLYPIRTCTMHSRLITHDDELYLHVETKRILTAVGVEI